MLKIFFEKMLQKNLTFSEKIEYMRFSLKRGIGFDIMFY